MKEPLKALRTELQAICDLHSIEGVLHWDQATYMPPGGAPARARQTAMISTLAHERQSSARLGALLRTLRPLEAADSTDGALVRKARRDYERATRVPADFVRDLRAHLARSYVAWTEARPANDFGRVRPFLERTVELSRRMAGFFPPAESIADPLIDAEDPGMTSRQIRSLFAELREHLVPMVRAIGRQPKPETGFLYRDYPAEPQLDFALSVARRIGYDLQRGRQDKAPHPFMTRFSAGDIRITTRVKTNDLTECLFSTIHEAGHALYELGIDPELDATPLGQGVSAGIHESQSRLWENIVGRSHEFWRAIFGDLRSLFPEQLDDVDVDAFYRGINHVTPSLIRTDADEVTYNLHVMLRFELETRMLEGTLAVEDLPEAWAAAMEETLGVAPDSDTDGVLQDVHWYGWEIGAGFQGYTLGNVMSAQFYDAALRANPDIPDHVANGRFSPLREWLTRQVYHHGASLDPLPLVEKATGRPLTTEPYVRYLKNKYEALYGLGMTSTAAENSADCV